jgi:hypothetical protein
MNPFEMVLGIIIVVTIGQVLKTRMGVRKNRHGDELVVDHRAASENAQLRHEMVALKDRIAVLERVITDNDSGLRLDREIEKLRDGRN